MTGVSVVVPCYNEAQTIGLLLEAVRRQTYPLADLEVVIADGMSTDDTREVVRSFAQLHPELAIRLVDNPDRIIPAALNRAIEQARGEVIVRLDAHSIPRPDYIRRCLNALEETGAANTGGVWEIRPSTERWIARSIAAAAAHPLGAGDARYRYGGEAGKVDTVPFGTFRREWIDRVGPFDESLPTNEDYEFNVRLRQAGGTIWFDPSIRSVYFTRGNLVSLARQYLRYGYWKARMLIRHPRTLRWRQGLPGLFVLLLLALVGAAPFSSPLRALLAVYLGTYTAVTLTAGVVEAIRRRDPALILGFPLALWTMHIAWGAAFLWGLVGRPLIGVERDHGPA
jgi:glycosyltransferase involved in cell wall biosynthesis